MPKIKKPAKAPVKQEEGAKVDPTTTPTPKTKKSPKKTATPKASKAGVKVADQERWKKGKDIKIIHINRAIKAQIGVKGLRVSKAVTEFIQKALDGYISVLCLTAKAGMKRRKTLFTEDMEGAIQANAFPFDHYPVTQLRPFNVALSGYKSELLGFPEATLKHALRHHMSVAGIKGVPSVSIKRSPLPALARALLSVIQGLGSASYALGVKQGRKSLTIKDVQTVWNLIMKYNTNLIIRGL